MAATLVRHGSRSAGDTRCRLPRGNARCVIAKLPPIGSQRCAHHSVRAAAATRDHGREANSVRISVIGLLKGFLSAARLEAKAVLVELIEATQGQKKPSASPTAREVPNDRRG